MGVYSDLCKAAEDRRDELQISLAAKKEEVEKAEKEAEDLAKDLSELEESGDNNVSALKNDLNEKVAELGSIKATFAELTEGVATSKAAIEKLEADRMICVAQLAEDDTIMANQESTIKDLTKTIADREHELKTLEKTSALKETALQNKFEILLDVSDIERKCTREYLAYEKQKGARKEGIKIKTKVKTSTKKGF